METAKSWICNDKKLRGNRNSIQKSNINHDNKSFSTIYMLYASVLGFFLHQKLGLGSTSQPSTIMTLFITPSLPSKLKNK
ncbi:hypothetical protein V6Z12_D11G151000 [Gossypium hirsutum]